MKKFFRSLLAVIVLSVTLCIASPAENNQVQASTYTESQLVATGNLTIPTNGSHFVELLDTSVTGDVTTFSFWLSRTNAATGTIRMYTMNMTSHTIVWSYAFNDSVLSATPQKITATDVTGWVTGMGIGFYRDTSTSNIKIEYNVADVYANGYGDYYTGAAWQGAQIWDLKFEYTYAVPTAPVISIASGGYIDSLGRLMLAASISDAGNDEAGVIERGFQVGDNSTLYNLATYSETATLALPFAVGGFVALTDAYPARTNYYVRAFAVNSAMTGYSTEITIPYSSMVSTNATGIQILIVPASGGGTYWRLSGTIANSSIYPCTSAGFSYGISANATGFQTIHYDVDIRGDVYVYLPELLPSTTYYFKLRAYIHNNWYESDILSFATGLQTTDVNNTRPILETVSVTGITENSFTANGNLVSLNGCTVIFLGFQVSRSTSTDYDQMYGTFGSHNVTGWAVGSYSGIVGGYNAPFTGQNVYVRAFGGTVSGNYTEGYGQWMAVSLTEDIPAINPGTTPPLIDDINIQIKRLMSSLGMDNILGHWLFMVLIMAVVGMFIGAFIVGNKDDMAKKILWLFLGTLELAIFGGFVFSGLLGIWAVAILVIVAVGLIIILGGKLLNQGRLDA